MSDNAYSTTDLTFSDCTYVNGGYCVIGNVVLFNIQINVTVATSGSSKKYITFPTRLKPKGGITVSMIAENYSNDEPPIYCAASGSQSAIFLKGTAATKAYIVSGMWII